MLPPKAVRTNPNIDSFIFQSDVFCPNRLRTPFKHHMARGPRLRVRAFDPASLFGLMLPPLTKPRQDPGNNYVQDCLHKMSRPSTPALHRASGNRLRGAGLRSREKAPFYERLGTKPAAKATCRA